MCVCVCVCVDLCVTHHRGSVAGGGEQGVGVDFAFLLFPHETQSHGTGEGHCGGEEAIARTPTHSQRDGDMDREEATLL